MKYLLSILLVASSWLVAEAQSDFVARCLGVWKGEMLVYAAGEVRYKVPVQLTVAPTAVDTAWTWRTDYLSEQRPMTKDYVLRAVDAKTGVYMIDEGDGIMLEHYVFGDKMYGMFEVEDLYLTSSYELVGGKLIFEVTFGKEIVKDSTQVTTFTVDGIQRIEFTKE